ATPAEQVLWSHLRGRRLGARFRDRHVIVGFYVDFYAPSIRLAVEVDGGVHDEQREYDEERTRVLAGFGVTVVRVRNDEVMEDLAAVLSRITLAIERLRK
ncbi:MAG: DUF559 domain-containing protein, partial [Deltaproteobacteria bacterium]